MIRSAVEYLKLQRRLFSHRSNIVGDMLQSHQEKSRHPKLIQLYILLLES